MDISEEIIGVLERIKNRRIELSLSYKDLAEKTGISERTLKKYETSKTLKIPMNKFEILARGLEMDPAELIGWEK